MCRSHPIFNRIRFTGVRPNPTRNNYPSPQVKFGIDPLSIGISAAQLKGILASWTVTKILNKAVDEIGSKSQEAVSGSVAFARATIYLKNAKTANDDTTLRNRYLEKAEDDFVKAAQEFGYSVQKAEAYRYAAVAARLRSVPKGIYESYATKAMDEYRKGEELETELWTEYDKEVDKKTKNETSAAISVLEMIPMAIFWGLIGQKDKVKKMLEPDFEDTRRGTPIAGWMLRNANSIIDHLEKLVAIRSQAEQDGFFEDMKWLHPEQDKH